MKISYKLFVIFALFAIVFLSCSKKDEEEQPPFAKFAINPEQGFVSTEFTFDATESKVTNDKCTSLLYKWDFDGDGNWDTGCSKDKIEKHTYLKAGIYEPKLEIRDCNGWTNFYIQTLEVMADTTTSK